MAPKQKQNKKYTPSKSERTWLITYLVILILFVVFVAIATQGSLSFYTILHAFLALFIVIVLCSGKSSFLIRFALLLGIIGAVTAIWLVIAYMPYYVSYLQYINNLHQRLALEVFAILYKMAQRNKQKRFLTYGQRDFLASCLVIITTFVIIFNVLLIQLKDYLFLFSIDLGYAFALYLYILLFTGKTRSEFLKRTMILLSIFGAAASIFLFLGVLLFANLYGF